MGRRLAQARCARVDRVPRTLKIVGAHTFVVLVDTNFFRTSVSELSAPIHTPIHRANFFPFRVCACAGRESALVRFTIALFFFLRDRQLP
jgi:hypothetical protein